MKINDEKSKNLSFLDYFCSLLEKQFLQTGFILESEINSNFSVKHIKGSAENKNLYNPMTEKVLKEFSGGNGKELDGKIYAIRSSSAMIFNLLGNEKVFIKEECEFPAGEYHNKYEFPLKTLTRTSKPAYIDAFLENQDNLIFIEAKCLEWLDFNLPNELVEAYKDKERYIYTELANTFALTAKEILTTQYDAPQMFRHLVGIYNYLKENNIQNKKVHLVNVIWDIPINKIEERFQNEYQRKYNLELAEFNYFRNQIDLLLYEINKDTNCEVKVDLLSVREFYKMIDYKDSKQAAFCKRYLGSNYEKEI